MEQTFRGSPSQAREFILGISGAPVPAGESFTFRKVTEVAFIPQRLIIPSTIGEHFEVEDVRVGNQSIWSHRAIPAIRFSEMAPERSDSEIPDGIALDERLADVGREVSIRVKNISNTEQNFANCAVIGLAPNHFEEAPPSDGMLPGWDYLNRNRSAAFNHDDLPIMGDSIGAEENVKLRAIKALERIAGLIAEQIVPPPPKEPRINMVGFDITKVPAGNMVEVIKRPQIIFRGERLSIPDSIAENFMIVDIKVGKNSQLIASGEMPASTFRESAPPQKIKLDVCQVSMNITLWIRNKTNQDQEFSATMFGPVID